MNNLLLLIFYCENLSRLVQIFREQPVFFNSPIKIKLMIHAEKKRVFPNSVHKCCFAVSDLFHMFTQSFKFYTFHYHVLKSKDISNMRFIKQIVIMNGCSFQKVLRQNLGLVFVLTPENGFCQRFHFKANRKSIGSSKKT